MAVACGNDAQFARLVEALGQPALAGDERFRANSARVRNLAPLRALLAEELSRRGVAECVALFDNAGVPCGPINSIPQALADPQTTHREMVVFYASGSPVPQVVSPMRFREILCLSTCLRLCWGSIQTRSCVNWVSAMPTSRRCASREWFTARIPLTGDNLTPEQQAVYNKVISGPRGAVVGPLRAALHVPELADRWQSLGEYKIPLPHQPSAGIERTGDSGDRVSMAFAARMARPLAGGREGGHSGGCDRSHSQGEEPCCPIPRRRRCLSLPVSCSRTGWFPILHNDQAYRCLGTAGLVELSAISGYYTMVALTLNAHHIYPPRGEQHGGEQPLGSDTGPLPPARRAGEA